MACRERMNNRGRIRAAVIPVALLLGGVLSILPAAGTSAAQAPGAAAYVPLPEEETQLWKSYPWGNFAADSAKDSGGTKLALVDNASVLACLQGEDVPLATAELGEGQLQELLEDALSGIEMDMDTETISSTQEELGDFLQIAGFSFRYDPTAPVGERVVDIQVDGDWPMTVTAPERVLVAGGVEPVSALEVGLSQAVDSYRPESGDTDFTFGRITVIGTADITLTSGFPRWILIAIPLLAAVLVGFSTRRNNRWKDTKGVFLKRQ